MTETRGITRKRRSDGSTAFLARIGKGAAREARTFDTLEAAEAWRAKRRGGGDRPKRRGRRSRNDFTLAEMIARYLADKNDLAYPKKCVLEKIGRSEFASTPCIEIEPPDIIDYARERLGDGVKPSTAGRYLAEISVVLNSYARLGYGLDISPSLMRDTWLLAKRLGVVGKSRRRDRRPTLEEIDALMKFFASRHEASPASPPMHRIIAFAIFSTRRRGEITRLAWADLDAPSRKILVRDMKNPGQKIGNNIACSLPPPALEILQALPKTGSRIFPWRPEALSSAFGYACDRLNIRDLRFHDLRHEGITRLFELGFGVPEAAKVSGHANWQSLQRYTHFEGTGDRYKDWPWLEAVTSKLRRPKRKGA